MKTWELSPRERDESLKAYELSGHLENEPELGLKIHRYDDGREDLVTALIADENCIKAFSNILTEAITGRVAEGTAMFCVQLPLSTWLTLLANAERFRNGTETILNAYNISP